MRLTGSSDGTSAHAAAIRDALKSVRSRWRTLAVLRLGAGVALVIATVWLTAWVVVRMLGIGGGALAAVAAVALAISGAACLAAVLLRRPIPGDQALARYIDRKSVV